MYWGFLVPNPENWPADDSEAEQTAFLHFAWSLFQISFEQYDGGTFPHSLCKHFGAD